jgi:hypothetical protein
MASPGGGGIGQLSAALSVVELVSFVRLTRAEMRKRSFTFPLAERASARPAPVRPNISPWNPLFLSLAVPVATVTDRLCPWTLTVASILNESVHGTTPQATRALIV